jgi:hypothetical protein
MESPFGFGIVSINWTLDGNNVNLNSVKYDGNILGTVFAIDSRYIYIYFFFA